MNQYALLDNDVEEHIERIVSGPNNHVRESYLRRKSKIKLLPWTPEIGLLNDLAAHTREIRDELRRMLGDTQLSLEVDGFVPGENFSGRPRNECKKLFSRISDQVAQGLSNQTADTIKNTMMILFAKRYFSSNPAACLGFLGPVINK